MYIDREGGREVKNKELEELYATYAKPLYYYLLQMSGSAHVAEELVQETFFRATLSLDLYAGGSAKSWLFTVARHAYLDEWRKRKRWNWVPFQEFFHEKSIAYSPDGIPLDEVLYMELVEDVQDILGMLPENYRTVLYLREYEQCNYNELAQIMGLSINQVKVTLHRARKRFKQIATRQGKSFERRYNNGVE